MPALVALTTCRVANYAAPGLHCFDVVQRTDLRSNDNQLENSSRWCILGVGAESCKTVNFRIRAHMGCHPDPQKLMAAASCENNETASMEGNPQLCNPIVTLWIC